MIDHLYAPSLSLLTDLYQLTMGYGYWRNEMHHRRAVFHLFFRNEPFGGRYAVAAGLGPAVEWLCRFQVTPDDVQYLHTLRGNDGSPLFSSDFLQAIAGMRLSVDIDAMPEGTIAMAHQPLVRVTGPLWQCQWIETTLLCVINFQTLIATKASRVCEAAEGDGVVEFGLRRAQGMDGALSASRAAYIGGCVATSNVLAGKMLGIPVKGTHAHSWVMSFGDELASFRAYADAMPNNCIFLVDTYDTIEGVKHAIQVGLQLRQAGHRMVGIRLDSGDLAELSIVARAMLDEAGLNDAVVVASNDLDEFEIAKLKARGAPIGLWGVGTNLVTARDQPALGGVYKLGAIEDGPGQWAPRIKLSDLPIKTSTPGIQQVRRYEHGEQMVGDITYSQLIGPPETAAAESFDGERIELPANAESTDLLVPIMRAGKLVHPLPCLQSIQQHASRGRSMLAGSVRALTDAQAYPHGLELRLAEQKRRMIRVRQS